MAINLVNTKISTQVLNFQPGGLPASFDVTVVNESNQFASFEIEIIAAGSGESLGSNWYKITPSVSAKNPPGDSTKFNVTIINTPVAGFIGKMNLIVRIFSLELRSEDRQILRLIVEAGAGTVPMQVELITEKFPTLPRELIEIKVRVFNPSQLPASVSLKPVGLKPQWFINGDEKLLQVAPGTKIETSFLCQLPIAEELPSQAYPFTIEANYPNGIPSRSQEGIVNVNPVGSINFKCFPDKRQMPEFRPWLPQPGTNSTTYQLECRNLSNLSQQISIEIKEGEERQPKCFWEVKPEFLELQPGETQNLQLVVKKRRHWFGLIQKLSFKVNATVSDHRINANDENQFIRLIIYPILHIWLQIVLGTLLLILLWFLSWLNPDSPFFGHSDAVTFVQFNGVGDRAVSASLDQSIIRWNIAGFINPLINQQEEKIKGINKSVRIVRYKPIDNDVVAAGLENAEIQLRDVLGSSGNKVIFSIENKDDRVFGLEFSQDSRFLFSGHGSGAILQWNVNSALLGDSKSLKEPINTKNGKNVNFAISTLTLAGKDKQNLVIAGRYNNLAIWNYSQDQLWKVPYNPPGSQNDYIESVDSAEYNPDLLATADTMGQITLWNMKQCLDNRKVQCQIIDQWRDGHESKAVRSVALSRYGCYLVSGGDDNQVMLWPLSKEGKREPDFINGIKIQNNNWMGWITFWKRRVINSVDIKVVRNKILVISGNNDSTVGFSMIDIDKKSTCQEQLQN
ncbi:hypothetical protein IQ244_16035 [Nostoc sp. LEGE 06077]|uniref:hypothetical protein n=1 Tax=Nostoc sp. LEGE 06077 TaxID=915325 RepID=UPI00187E3194|nr:hypothetical protein [Nostoc sp. LEGE 06077]MBE9208006.1 hypothetical protein [Nostoc sp. LEGE 06077]